MLFILTGAIQTGKTRWLERLVQTLCAAHVECCGVLTPGVWRLSKMPATSQKGEGAEVRYEKQGIDTLLMPEGKRIAFAKKRDASAVQGAHPLSQSARAQLGWEISEEALAKVNRHFAALSKRFSEELSSSTPTTERPDERYLRLRLLVIDEVGRLELEHAGGFTEALKLLQSGSTRCCPHALIVVRSTLYSQARHLFSAPWHESISLRPDDASSRLVCETYGIALEHNSEYSDQ